MSVDMTSWIESWESRRRLVDTAGTVSVVAVFVALLSFNLLVALAMGHGRGRAPARRHGRGASRAVLARAVACLAVLAVACSFAAAALPVWRHALRSPEPPSFASRMMTGFGLAGVQCETGDAPTEHGMPLEDGGYSCTGVDGRRLVTLRMRVHGGTVSFRDMDTGSVLEPVNGNTEGKE